MSLFGMIPSAYAQATTQPAPGAGDMLQNFAPLILIFVIFYFLLIRPQQQKTKQLRTQLSQLRRGDSVVTAGGIIGTVARVTSDEELAIDIADGVRVRVVRSTITGVVSKGEPADSGKAEPPDEAAPDKQAGGASKTARRGKSAAEG
jgi:preprotein translocase subunit YajC